MLAILPEGPLDAPAIEDLLDRAFGLDRFRKASYRYRPGVPPVAELCLVAREGAAGRLAGAIRFWPVRLAGERCLLLGPLAIDPDRQGRGVGRALVGASLARAEALGWRLVFLVGDAAYYARFGFSAALTEGLWLPGPYERDRFQAIELEPGALAGARGLVQATGEREPEPDWAALVAAAAGETRRAA